MVDIYSDLHQHIPDKFYEASVELMSPHYTQIRKGHKTTTSEDYCPSWAL
jgi:hypothetical protein